MPVAFEPSSAGAEAEGLLDVPLLEPQAARKDGPRTSAAAAAAPPPMNRLRDVGLAAIAWIFEEGMATLPFVDVREKAGRGSVTTSRRASLRGLRWSGCRRPAVPVTRRGPNRHALRRPGAASADP